MIGEEGSEKSGNQYLRAADVKRLFISIACWKDKF